MEELVETLREELEETKQELNSLEEQHDLLQNEFDIYKEETAALMKKFSQDMRDLFYSVEKVYHEIAPAVRGKSFSPAEQWFYDKVSYKNPASYITPQMANMKNYVDDKL